MRAMVRRNNRNHGGDANECMVEEEIGGGEPNRWASERERSPTSGPADAQGPPGSDSGGGERL
jgi:hypothetical protein